ncbi:class I SAM-dependent methyltransferase [Umezawaea sp. Da 62-37]|uniref:class I SAM-dependent methyltransferase n=1 Tax=Umezawaea sp. Da 62-37 TaxID=3075927 RepID=UPI0028F70B71|nr:class I SAM-dependent methyltransferase [Umezawaea sp. Da 62-37]WNV83677.1 class I SAM-dependent methyltransferase [Umezawaea sp. Da 62-37]
MLPDLSLDLTARLRDAFETADYDTDGVLSALGPQAQAALTRGEPEPARRASGDAGALGTMIRLFLLGDAEPEAGVRTAFKALDLDSMLANELLRATPDGLRAGLDIRPHAGDDRSWWVVADLDAEQRGGPVPGDHVLGIGQASVSLARATARRPVDTLLDLGTGCGVQALHASRHAERITATDLSERALALAKGTFHLNGLDVELGQGEWFGPVADRRFDQIVCNPPFVVGPPRVDYTYRDSGLGGDDASALVVRRMPSFLNEGGVGQLLASWLHRKGEDWADRVSGWLPRDGVDAWFVQRDIADPGLYVGTWLRDAGVDPRSPEGREKASVWLDWFAHNDVEGIGFGFVTLRRTDGGHAEVVCEDLRHAYVDPLGPETSAWLDRVDWLRANGSAESLLATRFTVPESVLLEEVSSPAEEGWTAVVRRLHRQDGPGWQHELDEVAAALLSGCRGALPLEDLVTLLAFAHDQPLDGLIANALPVVRDLVRHGMLRPL